MILRRRIITTVISVGLACLFSSIKLTAQQGVGVGTTEPDESAILDVFSTTKGLLLPRMSSQQRLSIQRPAAGLMVYQHDLLLGVYMYDGTDWQALSTLTAASLAANSTSWRTTGNEALGTDFFLGTTDDSPLIFKINNEFSGLLDSKRSNTFFGYKTGWATKSFNSVVIGAFALQRASTGNDNVVIGFQSMFSHENGQYNVALGSLTLSSSLIGDKNTALGAMAGFRSKGSANVFVGFQAGYFEQGDNKLYINNNASQIPLIYGDFKTKFVGINTSEPTNKLSIKGDRDGDSGLQFQTLTSVSAALVSNGKALSVDEAGNVILVSSSGPNSAAATTNLWIERANTIQNATDVDVSLTKNLIVAQTVKSNRLEVQEGGVVFKKLNAQSAALEANGKSLSLDNLGNIILVNAETAKAETAWQIVGNDILNVNTGKVFIRRDLEVASSLTAANGLIIKRGQLKFDNLSANSTPTASNGKVLTLDTNGNVILATDGVGSTEAGQWKKTGTRVELQNAGQVVIGEGITKFPTGYNLFVSKGILTERLRIAVPNLDKWADYVFKPNYKLMPLYEVEKHINTFGHLPGIYSAQEATDQGMDVLDMSVKLLQKVEELTLYAIEADKRIERLEAIIKKLDK
ncbi:MAG: hypothetical protein NWQ46_07000 [Spirosomaceae bacterium]|nr:hypothetical protein [Spirosomataceae bacterium]